MNRQPRAELERLLVADEELRPFMDADDDAGRARALMLQQRQGWDLCGRNYAGLASVRARTFPLELTHVHVQWNPGRLTSTAARVDEHTIRTRKCFLCPDNLPEAQRGFLYGDSFLVLCNPYPILPEHFTIPHTSHIPQRLAASFETLLTLGRDLGRLYSVFYNGPRCGASAPDHQHFQAGTRDFLPLERDLDLLVARTGEDVSAGGTRVVCVTGGLRPFVLLQDGRMAPLQHAFERLYEVLAAVVPAEEEPRMNLIVRWEKGRWDVIVIPRVRHRPSLYEASGRERLLLSPAAVDLGGICVLPLEEDFHRITSSHLETVFREVCLTGEGFSDLVRRLRQVFGNP